MGSSGPGKLFVVIGVVVLWAAYNAGSLAELRADLRRGASDLISAVRALPGAVDDGSRVTWAPAAGSDRQQGKPSELARKGPAPRRTPRIPETILPATEPIGAEAVALGETIPGTPDLQPAAVEPHQAAAADAPARPSGPTEPLASERQAGTTSF